MITKLQAGCFLDNHRGHYIVRDMILLAVEFGFIISPIDSYVISLYDEKNGDEDYPTECLQEISDEALAWLNGGPNEGKDRANKFQNSPPVIPDGYAWEWFDGDFGLYPTTLFTIHMEDEGNIGEELDEPSARELLLNNNCPPEHINRLLDQAGRDIPLQVGVFTVTAFDNHI